MTQTQNTNHNLLVGLFLFFNQFSIIISSGFVGFFLPWKGRSFMSVCPRRLLSQGNIFVSSVAEKEPEVSFRAFSWTSAHGHKNLVRCSAVLSGLFLLCSVEWDALCQQQWPSLEPGHSSCTSAVPHWHVLCFQHTDEYLLWLCSMLCRWNCLLSALWPYHSNFPATAPHFLCLKISSREKKCIDFLKYPLRFLL